MNRRELITGATAIVVGTPLIAQEPKCHNLVPSAAVCDNPDRAVSGSTTTTWVAQPEVPVEKRKERYLICKERGHRPTVWGNLHSWTSNTLNSVFVAVSDGPPKTYPNVGEGEWTECWDCKTRYRFVTTMEEENTP